MLICAGLVTPHILPQLPSQGSLQTPLESLNRDLPTRRRAGGGRTYHDEVSTRRANGRAHRSRPSGPRTQPCAEQRPIARGVPPIGSGSNGAGRLAGCLPSPPHDAALPPIDGAHPEHSTFFTGARNETDCHRGRVRAGHTHPDENTREAPRRPTVALRCSPFPPPPPQA